MTTRTRTRKSAKDRKAEIVDAAIALAGDIGPDRLTTERLAAKVGISQPGIFRHFPTKGAIWEAVAKRIGGLLQTRIGPGIDRTAEPAAQLRQMVIAHLNFIQTTPAIPAILFSRELHAGNEKLRAFFAGLIASRQKRFSSLIAAEIASGRFDAALDPDDAANLVLGLIQGLAMRWSLNARRFDLVAEGRRLIELQLNGFRPKRTQTSDGDIPT
ncbi:hypothetical protein MNBD_ALPHA09-2355 [hydrothermal vent metagenome]|uniref:HTH tetR-type domain-containing protein n=1 Tax=hydrothermal vent metagenome TaxID=652676 RepID=A0A3B0TPK2_9ZZZZ